MKQQTKKEIWYWLIIGTAILLFLMIGYSSRDSNQAVKSNKDKNLQTQSAENDQPASSSSEPSDNGDQNPAQGGASEKIDYKTIQSGGQLGLNYLLDDVRINPADDSDCLEIRLLPKVEKTLPKWQAVQTDNKIKLSLSDVSNFDITTGSKTYTGKEELISTSSIRRVKIDTSAGDQLTIKVTTDIRRAYQVIKFTSPLRLILEVY